MLVVQREVVILPVLPAPARAYRQGRYRRGTVVHYLSYFKIILSERNKTQASNEGIIIRVQTVKTVSPVVLVSPRHSLVPIIGVSFIGGSRETPFSRLR